VSDVILNDPRVVVTGDALDVQGHDLELRDAKRMREPSTHTGRRALVHDFSDGLTINYNNDFPGGVTINDLKVIPPRRRSFSGASTTPQPINVAAAIVQLQEQVEDLYKKVADLSARVP